MGLIKPSNPLLNPYTLYTLESRQVTVMKVHVVYLISVWEPQYEEVVGLPMARSNHRRHGRPSSLCGETCQNIQFPWPSVRRPLWGNELETSSMEEGNSLSPSLFYFFYIHSLQLSVHACHSFAWYTCVYTSANAPGAISLLSLVC